MDLLDTKSSIFRDFGSSDFFNGAVNCLLISPSRFAVSRSNTCGEKKEIMLALEGRVT